MKLKRQHFETVSESKGNCKWYSKALRRMTPTVILKHRKNYGVTAYVPMETVLKEMAVNIKLNQLFFDIVWELSNRPSHIKTHFQIYFSKFLIY
jgi:hypothetical protein